ncbi:sterol desaturase family protein [Ostreibacterium oceani]|uniref:Sterol desaturase family protein n=1 Tax=Ostreibacterium oceani TaxID=2654998 RepID=A0A6N7EUY5_9GAMM|nr:sterol desaturase family protein [Ostreibacterium oceani]MPV85783.1 sterol desaturase family protein [Ostreibacterium oceani]
MTSEIVWRLGVFFAVLLAVALAEHWRPKRQLTFAKSKRWTRNLALVVANTLALRLFVPFTAASVAIYATQQDIGLFNWLNLPFYWQVILSVIVLDLIIYGQHVVFHYVPWLWRLHKVHHIDQDIDVTTGLRFHPLEIIISALIKCSAVWLLGVPFLAVVLFEILLNATALFNHGNLRLPHNVDRVLRKLLVTPDMHRVHHSTRVIETNSNFGFNLSCWDYLFKTYRAQPKAGHQAMKIGLSAYPDAQKTGFWWLLVLPFKRQATRNPSTANNTTQSDQPDQSGQPK